MFEIKACAAYPDITSTAHYFCHRKGIDDMPLNQESPLMLGLRRRI
jgi:hypothetical protein